MDLIRRFVNCSIQFFFQSQKHCAIHHARSNPCTRPNQCMLVSVDAHTHAVRNDAMRCEFRIVNGFSFISQFFWDVQCRFVVAFRSLFRFAVSWCYSRFRYFLCFAVAWVCANKNRKVCNICRISLFLRITAFFGLCIMLPWFGSAVVLSRFCR